jgi:alkylhydroperoxidase/carboxymuconolactone decarboxylase family protein YurZ
MDPSSPSPQAIAGMQILQKLNFIAPGAKPMVGSGLMQATVEHLFGTIWARPGLELAERSLITLTVLVALNREHELVLHFRGARNLGLSKDRIEEMILHVAHYAGWPCAVSANRILNEVWETMDQEQA